MEIERKYLIPILPKGLSDYPRREIEQGYLNTEPVIRIRRDNDSYELTYKSAGLMVREEYNMPLTREAYDHLSQKIDGHLIKKTRYMIPLNGVLTIELDVFRDRLAPLCIAEVEFPDVASADSFVPPAWFGEDVTYSGKYQNSRLSQI